MVIVLSIEPNVHGLIRGQERWIFKGDKNPYHGSLRRSSKISRPHFVRLDGV
jgi:hypothetical protein